MRHPRDMDWDSPCSAAAFAELVDGDAAHIGRMQTRGVLPKGGTALQWFQLYCRHMRLKAAGRGDLDSNLAHERAELTRVQKEIAEIQLMVKRGEFAPVSVVTRQMARVVSGLSTRLVAIPRELQKHHPEMTVAQIRKVQAIVSAACEDAVRQATDSLPLDEDDEDAEAA